MTDPILPTNEHLAELQARLPALKRNAEAETAMVSAYGDPGQWAGASRRLDEAECELESEPLLVFSSVGSSPHRIIEAAQTQGPYQVLGSSITDTTNWYIIDRDPGGKLLFYRDIHNELNTSSTTLPGGYLEIGNVGRSPAVGITITVHVETDLSHGMDEPPKKGQTSSLLVDAVAAQSSYFIGVSNQLSQPIHFRPDQWATQVVWGEPGAPLTDELQKKPLRVLSLVFVFPPSPPRARTPLR